MGLQYWRLARMASSSLLYGFATLAIPRSIERLDGHRASNAFKQPTGDIPTRQDWQICKACRYRNFFIRECISRSVTKEELDAHQENIDKMRYDLRRSKPIDRAGWKRLGGVRQTTTASSTNIDIQIEFPWDVTEEHLDARQNILDQIREVLQR